MKILARCLVDVIEGKEAKYMIRMGSKFIGGSISIARAPNVPVIISALLSPAACGKMEHGADAKNGEKVSV